MDTGITKNSYRRGQALEELFANCWLLGRISDVIHHILDERERTTGSPKLCDRLEIQEDSRITLTDVEQLRAGVKIGTCLWDVSNALHDKSATGELPAYVDVLFQSLQSLNGCLG
eukprot:jgi/Picre1/30657/NNA_006018.t1